MSDQPRGPVAPADPARDPIPEEEQPTRPREPDPAPLEPEADQSTPPIEGS